MHHEKKKVEEPPRCRTVGKESVNWWDARYELDSVGIDTIDTCSRKRRGPKMIHPILVRKVLPSQNRDGVGDRLPVKRRHYGGTHHTVVFRPKYGCVNIGGNIVFWG